MNIFPPIFKGFIASLLLSLLSLPRAQAQFMADAPQMEEGHGSSLVESMYVRGLNYLMSAQKDDPSSDVWNVPGEQVATCSFTVMSALAHGDDPNVGPYAEMIKKSLDFILSKQDAKTGYIGESMYCHGFATLALAESYGMVRDGRIGEALQKAVDLIIKSQSTNPLKAWRYTPSANDADMSVAGCQMVALFAARNAGIPIPDKAIADGLKYMETCKNEDAAYCYQYPDKGGGRVTLTSIGVLSKALAKDKDSPSFKKSLDYLGKNLNHRDAAYPYYLEYYMAQALFQADEEIWKQWNAKNIKYLKASQGADGSWPPPQGYSRRYATSFALLSLALNYRFLPIYEK